MLCAFARDIGISFHRAKHVLSKVEGTPSTQRIAQAEVCLPKCSKAVYWTLVQYGQGYRSLMENPKSEARNPNPPQGFERIRPSPRLIRPLADFGET